MAPPTFPLLDPSSDHMTQHRGDGVAGRVSTPPDPGTTFRRGTLGRGIMGNMHTLTEASSARNTLACKRASGGRFVFAAKVLL